MMNDNVKKVFDMLGVEPNEKFKIEGFEIIYYIDEKLKLYYKQGHYDNGDDAYNVFVYGESLIIDLIKNSASIIKLPKEPKKKKLRDLTPKEWDKWIDKECPLTSCDNCIFRNVPCTRSINKQSWVNNKDLYSDKFLDQEIEVEE